jgi:hypothetical protein
MRDIFTSLVGTLLLLSGLWHIFQSNRTEHWMSKPLVVRCVGGVLLLLAAACLAWRGWFFYTLFALLAVSGIWRLFFPLHSIRAQQRSYPRWVHGCLLMGGAMAIWFFRP